MYIYFDPIILKCHLGMILDSAYTDCFKIPVFTFNIDVGSRK